MLKTIVILSVVAILAKASPAPVGLFENEITKALQKALKPLDPVVVPAITDLHITTDHSSILFSATDVNFSGLSSIACTKFTPPIITKRTAMALKFGDLVGKTSSYTMKGEFEAAPYDASGVGELSISGLRFSVDFKTASYSISPVSVCIQPGSLSGKISADKILANFEGADEINKDINENADALLEQIEAQINALAPTIEATINAVLCKKA
ncbi:uncharacterized protein LOC135196450 isoform X2 [Macrobrachium nipponense]